MKYLDSAAQISDDGLYRYWLSRRIGMGERMIAFIGLNPSKADAWKDDPTIRRCVGFAKLWGFDWLFMGNIYAWRSTDPDVLPTVDDPVGPENREALQWITHKSERVVAAWGKHQSVNEHGEALAQIILALPHVGCLGQNKDGTPKHPLYLPSATPLRGLLMSSSVNRLTTQESRISE